VTEPDKPEAEKAPADSTWSDNLMAVYSAVRITALILARAYGVSDALLMERYGAMVCSRLNPTQKALFEALEGQVAAEGNAALGQARAIGAAIERLKSMDEERERLRAEIERMSAGAPLPVATPQAAAPAAAPSTYDELDSARRRAARGGELIDVACPKCGHGKGQPMPRSMFDGLVSIKCQECGYGWNMMDGKLTTHSVQKAEKEPWP